MAMLKRNYSGARTSDVFKKLLRGNEFLKICRILDGGLMITSFLDERARIKREELKNPETMDRVAGIARLQDGVFALAPNPRTGSLVVTYDPKKIPRETIRKSP